MTAKQTALYWREWQAVHKRYPDIDRHDLHIRALGTDKSSKLFTNADLDKILGQFRALTQPASLDAQLAQANQDKTRLLWKTEQYYLPLLALYVAAEPYILQIVRDGFPALRRENRKSEIVNLKSSLDTLSAKELQTLRNTLSARLNDLRKQAGHTIRQMHELAGLKVPA